jgi:hypothetical protein
MFLESYFEVLGVSNTLLELLSMLASIVLLFIVLIGGSGWGITFYIAFIICKFTADSR